VYDHTSVIRFLERWTGVVEPNISQWRRAVTGDLTGAFDFRDHRPSVPVLPDTATMLQVVDHGEPILEVPSLPDPDGQDPPVQAPGTRPARPLPYQPLVNATFTGGVLDVGMENQGTRPVQLAVYTPRFESSHLLAPAERVSVPITASGRYAVSVYGPNGFLRQFNGGSAKEHLEVALALRGTTARPALEWTVGNMGPSPAQILMYDAVGSGSTTVVSVSPGQTRSGTVEPLETAFGWYDLTFTVEHDPSFLRRFTGHLENGEPSRTYPGPPAALR
jgi:phospholipase C